MIAGAENVQQVVGIDCATKAGKIGLARGEMAAGKRVLTDVLKCRSIEEIAETVAGWLGVGGPTLMALDAPLGWPAPLGVELARHAAGEPLPGDANMLFRRETDRFIRSQLRKQPLDVGAARIARTAHAALALLAAIRGAAGLPVPLAWTPGPLAAAAAIEVYPAATLLALGLFATGYKGRDDSIARQRLTGALAREIAIPPALVEPVESDADMLDAALCVVAGFDFLDGRVLRPADLPRAQKEGWIWTRPLPER